MENLSQSLRIVSCLALPLIAAAGCTAIAAGGGYVAAQNYLNKEGTNIAAQNYATADFLIQQAETYISPDDLIVVEPLTDIQAPEVSTTVARLIPEQIGIRLSQLGYRVDLAKVTTTADTNYLRPSLKSGEEADFILTGNYLRRRNDLDVKTRIIDVKNNRIIAVFDYPIKLDADMRKLTKPRPVITRVSE